MQVVISKDYIWEYDLKNFFGEINLEYIYNYMVDKGVPKRIAAELRKINRSLTALTSEDRAPEPERRLLYTADLEPNPNYSSKIPPNTSSYVIIEEDDIPNTPSGGVTVPPGVSLELKEAYMPSQEQLNKLRALNPNIKDLSEMTDDSPVGSTFTVNWGHATVFTPEEPSPIGKSHQD